MDFRFILDERPGMLKCSGEKLTGTVLVYERVGNDTVGEPLCRVFCNFNSSVGIGKAIGKIARNCPGFLDKYAGDWAERIRRELESLEIEAYNKATERSNRVIEQTPAPELSLERREAALELLRDPGLLHRVLQVVERAGLVGEKPTALGTYLAATSRLLSDPINITITGDSASGKSTVVKFIMLLFPDEVQIVRWGMSARAALYSPDSWKNKVVVFLEQAGMEYGQEVFRVIQSEGKAPWEVAIKDEETGQWTTKVFNKEGPVAFIVTTVDPDTDEQNESRFLRLFTDDSPQQTYRVTASMYLNHQHVPTPEEIQVFQDAQRLLVDNKVCINIGLMGALDSWVKAKYGETIPPRFRRDWMRLMSSLGASAVLHQYQRQRNEAGQIIPTLVDYHYVWRAIGLAFSDSMVGLNDPSREVFRLMQERGQMQGAPEAMTQADLIEITHWSRSKVSRALAPLVRHGYVLEKGGDKPGGYKRYLPCFAQQSVALPAPKELVEAYSELADNLEEMVDPFDGTRLVF